MAAKNSVQFVHGFEVVRSEGRAASDIQHSGALRRVAVETRDVRGGCDKRVLAS